MEIIHGSIPFDCVDSREDLELRVPNKLLPLPLGDFGALLLEIQSDLPIACLQSGRLHDRLLSHFILD